MPIRMKYTLFTLAVLLMNTVATLAQEEAAAEAEGAPPGVSMFLLLLGLGAIALVGYVTARRDTSNES
ncbi:hypothetical protein G4Y79_20705 [Phototrophicus methaneseepsis]|uniref:Uncharacterized protein n=1 Tax=Phototrophicus methaneseepsis TaxID=2710758 RepID=A0A7S8IE08_9CHLR|nr:hypothetical protein [Phototrophicus methaneseepsis]QPC82077.1 hypothetical protein G4Y79_20705 [Phototrophicus methaneseepsis]